MSTRFFLLGGTLCLALIAASGGDIEADIIDDIKDEIFEGNTDGRKAQRITYTGSHNNIKDFRGRGMGLHLEYWPAFGLTTPQIGIRTDGPGTIERTRDFANFTHHSDHFNRRTFSPDARGDPIGVKTAGGYAHWDVFTLPDGRRGRSGTFYDKEARGSASNSVNQFRINVPNLHAFCLNLITDNTKGDFDPNTRIAARSDKRRVSLEGPNLTFDGRTTMYTFKYTGMEENDRIKIQLKADQGGHHVRLGPGLGGIMVSHIDTCSVKEPSFVELSRITPRQAAKFTLSWDQVKNQNSKTAYQMRVYYGYGIAWQSPWTRAAQIGGVTGRLSMGYTGPHLTGRQFAYHVGIVARNNGRETSSRLVRVLPWSKPPNRGDRCTPICP